MEARHVHHSSDCHDCPTGDEVLNFGGRKAQTFRVEAFEPNATLELVAIAGLGIRPTQRYALSSQGNTTTVSIRVTVRTLGLFRLRGLLESQPVVGSIALQPSPRAL